MKKSIGCFWVVLAAVMLLACAAQAAPALRQLPWQMGVKYGATHVLEFTHEDLTTATTNTTMVFTNTVAAPASVQFAGMLLDKAFDSVTVTNAFTMTVSCGPSDDTTKWLNAKEAAADGTEIRTSFGTDYSATTALTLTTVSLTNLLVGAAAADASVTNVTDAALVTGASGTVTVASPIVNEQTANVAIVTTFGTAGADRNHAEFESGRLRLFFRVWTPGMD